MQHNPPEERVFSLSPGFFAPLRGNTAAPRASQISSSPAKQLQPACAVVLCFKRETASPTQNLPLCKQVESRRGGKHPLQQACSWAPAAHRHKGTALHRWRYRTQSPRASEARAGSDGPQQPAFGPAEAFPHGHVEKRKHLDLSAPRSIRSPGTATSEKNRGKLPARRGKPGKPLHSPGWAALRGEAWPGQKDPTLCSAGSCPGTNAIPQAAPPAPQPKPQPGPSGRPGWLRTGQRQELSGHPRAARTCGTGPAGAGTRP